MTIEEFDNYKFSDNTCVKTVNGWFRILVIDFPILPILRERNKGEIK
jgi:hypothetical protein